MKDFSMEDLKAMAAAAVASKLYASLTEPLALVAFLIAQSNGQHPMCGLNENDVINTKQGPKLRLKTEVMARRFLDAGGKIEWITLTDDEATAKFSRGDNEVVIRWDMARAKKLGLLQRDYTPWRQGYTREMLRSRCLSEGVRSIYSALPGYTVDEIDDDDVPPPDSRPTATQRLDDALGPVSEPEPDLRKQAEALGILKAPKEPEPAAPERREPPPPTDPAEHARQHIEFSERLHAALDKIRSSETEKDLAGLVLEIQKLSAGNAETLETLKRAYAEQRHLLRSQGLTEKRRLFLKWIKERPDVSYEMVEDYIRNSREGQTVATIPDDDLSSIRDELSEILSHNAAEAAGGQEPQSN